MLRVRNCNSTGQHALTIAIAGVMALAPARAATFIIMTSDNPKAPIYLDADSSRGSVSQTGTQSALITINGPAGTTAKGDGQTITDSFEVAGSNGVSLVAQGSTTEPYSGPPVMFIEIQSYDYEGDPLTCAEGEIGVCTLKEFAQGSIVKLGNIIWSDGSVDTVYLQPPIKREKPPNPPSVPGWLGAILRVSITVAGPITPPPGTPVEAVVGLTDLNGNIVGQPQTVTLIQGQAASVDFNANMLVNAAGQHVDVVPAVSAAPNAFLPPVQLTTGVFDRVTGIGSVLTTSTSVPPELSSMGPQGLAGGQIMRMVVTAFPPAPCAGTLSFADSKGNPIGSTLAVDLPPGQSKFLDLDASTLSLQTGQRIQVQPMLTLQAPIGAAVTTSASPCAAAAEVFDRATGRTLTYQTARSRHAESPGAAYSEGAAPSPGAKLPSSAWAKRRRRCSIRMARRFSHRRRRSLHIPAH